MATPGWYPDPAGTPHTYRYFDGAAWSAETSTDPRSARPHDQLGHDQLRSDRPSGPSGPADHQRSRRRSPLGYVIVAVLLVGVLGIAGWLVIDRNRETGRPITDQTIGSPSISGWDDSQPTEQPSSAAPTAPSGEPTGPGGQPVACPFGDPGRREVHPNDGRVYGGNLSFPQAGNFQPAAPEPRLSFAYDVTQQVLPVHDRPGWIAQFAVGGLLGTDFTGRPAQVAESIMQCGITTEMYGPYLPQRGDLRSEAIAISGRSGWLIESDIRVSKEGLPFAGDKIIFIVIPDGEDWGMFFGAVPIGDLTLTNQLYDLVSQLQAT